MQRKIRVLQTIQQGQVGSETYILALVMALDRSGFEPMVLSFKVGPMVERLLAMGIKTYVIEADQPFNLTKWRAVRRLLHDERIDLVHAHGTWAHSNTFWAARRLGLPIVYTMHGYSFSPDQELPGRNRYSLNEVLPAGRARPSAGKNGLSAERSSSCRHTCSVRAELDIPNNVLLVGSIARLTAQNDPLTLLRAAALLPSELNIRFLLVGNGSLKPEAQQLARALNIEAKVTFIDYRADVADLLQSLDIYCLTSLWGGLPVGLVEAMAIGKPVVASSIEATRDLIEPGVNGLLVPPQNPLQLAAAIQRLATSPNLRQALCTRAYQTLQANFTAQEASRPMELQYLHQVRWLVANAVVLPAPHRLPQP